MDISINNHNLVGLDLTKKLTIKGESHFMVFTIFTTYIQYIYTYNNNNNNNKGVSSMYSIGNSNFVSVCNRKGVYIL